MKNLILICGALLMIGCGNRQMPLVAAPLAPNQIAFDDNGESGPAPIRRPESIVGHPNLRNDARLGIGAGIDCPSDLDGLYSFSGISPASASSSVPFDMIIDNHQMIQMDPLDGRIIHHYERIFCSGEFVNDDYDTIKFSLHLDGENLIGTVQVSGDYVSEHHYIYDVILIRKD